MTGMTYMNQIIVPLALRRHVPLPISFVPRLKLITLVNEAVAGLTARLHRRSQTISIDDTLADAVACHDTDKLTSLFCAVLNEMIGLSAPHSNLKVTFDHDEGEAVVVLLGKNRMGLRPCWLLLGEEISQLAREAGGSASILWDEDEGPTIIVRLPETELVMSQRA
jgi:hypothetical protein